MSGFWRNWLILWCGAAGVFGAVLAGGGFALTSGPVRGFFALLNGPQALLLDSQTRFTLGVLGAVSIGWSVTMLATIDAAIRLGPQGRPVWVLATCGVVSWFVVDTPISIATGYGFNAIPNAVFLATFLLAVVRGGALLPPAASMRAKD